ncbi:MULTISPECIES: N-acetylneuraminate synthase [unclassified Oscillibacter]|uniref:N-acetylneuraminate synthase n=1 Tax=unclassified Oscillibacter TaxID=2629304 RepID=UPI0025F84F64|nr:MULTISPECIES: N-acetylneuraminate synthase [unclassified Oscillibacter]
MPNNILIIAEAGVNHNGSLELACKLVDVAKQAGADIVKFQTFKAENLVTKSAKRAAYQIENTKNDDSQFSMLKSLELKPEEYIQLQSYCASIGIAFLSTPFDGDSIAFLETLDMPFWKIPSGEITNYPYLRQLAQTGKPVVLSTGMSTLVEIQTAVALLKRFGTPEITLLHCNTEYPTPMEDVNLSAMATISKATGLPVGYSDHTQGIEVPIAAVAMGAVVIEKHFTLDKTMDGPDHKASLSPEELTAMVCAIRNIEKAMGTGEKRPSASEEKNLPIARKSIVAKRAIARGEVFAEENLTTKRPGTGCSPMLWETVLGQRAARDYTEDELIEV